jgi:DNA invertase Pin-like site-specific DNA recombinase
MLESEEKIKNVAIYMRVSKEEQATEGYSLGSQLDRLRAYCKARQWTIAGEYTDGGFTGRNTKRPKYQEMMADMAIWDAVIVIKMDRIHRSQKNFMDMMQTLSKSEKEFVSMNESFDTSTAMGRFVMNIMALVAQLESEQTGERISYALIEKAKSDEASAMNHKPPYGYKWDKENHVHIEIPEQLDVIKKIFKEYLTGRTMKQIGEKYKLSRSNVRYYLHNSFYAGVERWCNFFRESSLEPVITIDDFNEVQRQMIRRAQRKGDLVPMLIKKGSFKIQKSTQSSIPKIQQWKHNWRRAW